MKHPYTGKNDAADRHSAHHDKANAHQHGNGDDNAELGGAGHSSSLHIAFKMILIKFGAHKPDMQFFRAFGKAERRQQQKRKGRRGTTAPTAPSPTPMQPRTIKMIFLRVICFLHSFLFTLAFDNVSYSHDRMTEYHPRP